MDKSNFLMKPFFECLQFLLCLLLIKALTTELCLKATFLHLECRYLTFRLGQTVKGKRKTLADNVRHRNLFERVLSRFIESHLENITSAIMSYATLNS